MCNERDSLTFRHRIYLAGLTFHQNQSINHFFCKLPIVIFRSYTNDEAAFPTTIKTLTVFN